MQKINPNINENKIIISLVIPVLKSQIDIFIELIKQLNENINYVFEIIAVINHFEGKLNSKDLKLARKRFMSEHKNVFRVLEAMQNAYYKSDNRRERFVSLCKDQDVQRLTLELHAKTVVDSSVLYQ